MTTRNLKQRSLLFQAKFLRPIVATIALLLVPVASQARHSEFGHSSATGDFDYYLLSLSLAPSFCALSPRNAAKQECKTLTEAEFQQTPLTVHGLWPNRARVSVNLQPHDCQGAPFTPPSGSVQTALQRYMPGGAGLEAYEWRKHGACSGLSPEDYFSSVVRLAEHVNDTVGAVMRTKGMLGHSLLIRDLLAGVADPALASAIVVNCQQPRGGGAALVGEIRITLSKDFEPIPASSVGMGQNSGCPGGRGVVPDANR